MPIHKLVDKGGEKYLPFALSKLRQLAKEAEKRGGYAVRRITTDDGFTIEISVAGTQQHLSISGRQVRYEFFTSDHILREVPGGGDVYFSSPGYSSDETIDGFARVVGSLTRVSFPSKKAKPIYSQTIPANGDTETWRNANPLEGLDPSAPRKGYPVSWGAWQFQKAFEHVWWPNNGKDSIVTSTQALAPGRNSQCNDLSPYKTFRLANYDAFISDYGLDVPPTFVDANGKQAAGPAFEDEFIWWRRAAVQKGYFICTDNIGRFHVYKIQDKRDGTPQPYSIPSDSFKTFTPPYPDWVTMPESGTFQGLTACWTWQFNKDATKCVACPFHSTLEENWFKQSYIFSAGARHFAMPGGIPEGWVNARSDVPGFVEFSINIIPGTTDDPLDFEVEFELLRSNYSGDGDGHFIFDAAYTLPDLDETMGVPEDTLVVSELQIFTTAAPPQLEFSTEVFIRHPEDIEVDAEVTNSVGPMRAEYVMSAFTQENMFMQEIMRFPVYENGQRMFFLTDNGYEAANFPAFDSVHAHEFSPYFVEQLHPVTEETYNSALLGYLHMVELRTMSIAYTIERYVQATSETKLYAYNALYREASGSIGTPEEEVRPEYDTPLPTLFTRVYSFVLDNVLDTVWGSGFNIHPAGHWSCSRGRGISGFDIIKPYDKPEVTHKDMFNKAFNQFREYTYYGLYSNFGRFFDSSIPTSGWDMGSFRTNGVWLTF
jgi:hypothetical protein